MREEQVFLKGRKCKENRSEDKLINEKGVLMKELAKSQPKVEQVSISKQIEMVQSSEKRVEISHSSEDLNEIVRSNDSQNGKTESNGEDMFQNSEKFSDCDINCNTENYSEQQRRSLPKVTITCPVAMDRPYDGPYYSSDATKGEKNEENLQKPGKLAGRRALPEITITCPPVEAFDIPELDDLSEGLFTKRKYMVCRESPRSGRRTVSLVDFPHGLSSLEKNDSLYLESPANFVDSPYSFSNVDLSFTYSSPLCSPFTPPFTPELRRSSKFIYPSAVPIFPLEESFPPAKFEHDTPTAST